MKMEKNGKVVTLKNEVQIDAFKAAGWKEVENKNAATEEPDMVPSAEPAQNSKK